jgi:hypothetical protein
MSTTPTFGPPLIGQTEKALNAILDRQLAGTGMTEAQWVTLTLTVAGGSADRGQLIGRVVAALKIRDAEADSLIAELAAAQLLQASDDGDASRVEVTDAGRQLHGRIRAQVGESTERLWGDLPAEDLASAGRVLSTVLGRANAELARGPLASALKGPDDDA